MESELNKEKKITHLPSPYSTLFPFFSSLPLPSSSQFSSLVPFLLSFLSFSYIFLEDKFNLTFIEKGLNYLTL
jgi:hypothetical protein